MNKLLKSLVLVALLAVSIQAYKIGVLSDIHIDLEYDPSYCKERKHFTLMDSSEHDETLPYAPLGRYGCDPPIDLLKTMIHKLRSTDPDIDFLLVPGDLVKHGLSLDPKDSTQGNYS